MRAQQSNVIFSIELKRSANGMQCERLHFFFFAFTKTKRAYDPVMAEELMEKSNKIQMMIKMIQDEIRK